MNRKRLALGMLMLTILFPAAGRAWWALGHMTVAKIAYERLTPKTKAAVDALIRVPVAPERDMVRTSTFVTAGVWADDVKKELGTGTWHYLDIPFSDDGTTPDLKENPMDIVKALDQCVATLKDGAASQEKKAVALRYVIHFMGDIHQPLHCTARCTADHPEGDAGGNGFKLTGVAGIKNLHALWDSGCGEMRIDPARPLDAQGEHRIEALAMKFTAANPPTAAAGQYSDFMALAREGFEVAKADVYTSITQTAPPSQAYLDRGQAVCEHQIALAGYRLANLLNSIYDPGKVEAKAEDGERAPR